jgi:hypothetical protein
MVVTLGKYINVGENSSLARQLLASPKASNPRRILSSEFIPVSY